MKRANNIKVTGRSPTKQQNKENVEATPGAVISPVSMASMQEQIDDGLAREAELKKAIEGIVAEAA